MQLKIEINMSQDKISPPAPFDPVKIRNFVLIIITLLSIIGFGVYTMLNEEPKPALPNTLNSPNNATVNNTTINTDTVNTHAVKKVIAQQPKTIEITETTKNAENITLTNNTVTNEISNTVNDEAAIAVKNQETNAILAEVDQNNIASNESSVQTQVVTTTKTTLETNTTEKALNVIDPTNVNSPVIANILEASAQEANRLETEIEPEIKIEIPSPIIETPTIANNANILTQKKADVLNPNQDINNVVRRAQLTSNIIDREPTNTIEHVSLQEQNKLYLFTEIIGKTNQKIIHRWTFKQNIVAQVTLNIGSYQWRTYSSKSFDDTMIGQWTVQIVDEDDNVLKTIEFEVLQ